MSNSNIQHSMHLADFPSEMGVESLKPSHTNLRKGRGSKRINFSYCVEVKMLDNQ